MTTMIERSVENGEGRQIGDERGFSGTAEGRKDGTTGTEETQTAADTSGTAAETMEDQKAPKAWRGTPSSLKPRLRRPGKTFILL